MVMLVAVLAACDAPPRREPLPGTPEAAVTSTLAAVSTSPSTTAEPASAPATAGRTEGPSSELVDALTGLGVDEATIPASVLDVPDARLCGVEVFQQSQMGDPARYDESVRRCFFDAHLAGLPAVFATSQPTIEGDPIVRVWRTTASAVGLWMDSTRDEYGSGTWDSSPALCGRLSAPPGAGPGAAPLDFWCTDVADQRLNAPTWAEVPSWLTQRPALPACGYEFDLEERDLTARTCLHDAIADGRPAEYVVLSTGDEGEIGVSWFRHLPDRTLEVLWLMHEPTPSWTAYRCTSFAPIAAPGLATDLLPTLRDCTQN